MRIGAVFAVTVLLLCGAVSAEPRVLIDTDFGAPGKAFSEVDAAKGNNITGFLPEGWSENTGWKTKAVAEYKPVTEAGRSFLRVTQTSGNGLQFTHALPGIGKEAGYYRLSFTARSVAGCYPGVRFRGAPYTTVWSTPPRLNAQWRDFTYDFRMTAQPQELGLFFYLSGNGVLDLEKLKLQKLSEQDLIEEVKARYPDGAPGNLVRASRFPLGLQSGWSIDREYSDGDQVQVAGDAQVPGPSGAPSLRISAPDGILVYSAPFATPLSFEPHTASLYVRGDWDGRLIAACGQSTRAAQPLKISGTHWQRVELTFKPVLLATSHHLRIQGKGTLWIDGFEVEQGAKATPYAPQNPVEVSLALPASDASSARVVFTDEPMKMNYAVVGPAAGALLKARLVTMYGDQLLLPPVKLGVESPNVGALAYEAFQPHPLGAYRLEAWVEDAAGKKLSAESEVVFYRLHRPRYWGKDAPNSFFGTHVLSTNRHLTMAKAVGCNWVRLHDAGSEYIGWAFLEPEKGQWRFRDADVQRYRDHHLKILGLLSTCPGWAGNLGRPCADYFDRYLEPLNMDDWANAVRAIVKHHAGTIDTYEIWNEPWGKSFWSLTVDPKLGRGKDAMVPSDTPSADYARLQKIAYAAAHEVLPQVTILGFNSCRGKDGTKWTKDVLDFGGMETCDAVSYHDYEVATTGYPGSAAEIAYQEAMGPILDKLGRMPKPVWMSEGAPRGDDVSSGFYRCTLPYENDSDNWRIADRLARFVISRRATGEKHAFLYTMHGINTFGAPTEWTTLVTVDGFLHPSAAAHSALAWLLEDTDYVRCVTLTEGVYAYLFTGPNGAVAAITARLPHAEYRLPTSADVQLFDLFGNPLAAGAALDDHVSFVVSNAGPAKLLAALGVK